MESIPNNRGSMKNAFRQEIMTLVNASWHSLHFLWASADKESNSFSFRQLPSSQTILDSIYPSRPLLLQESAISLGYCALATSHDSFSPSSTLTWFNFSRIALVFNSCSSISNWINLDSQSMFAFLKMNEKLLQRELTEDDSFRSLFDLQELEPDERKVSTRVGSLCESNQWSFPEVWVEQWQLSHSFMINPRINPFITIRKVQTESSTFW